MPRLDTSGVHLSKFAVIRLLLLTAVLAAPAIQALEVRPSVQVGAVYTDNLFLTPDNEMDDFVTRLDPRIDISHKSERINLLADYTYTFLRYADASDSNAEFSQGSANLDLTLIKNAFYLESVAELSQQIVDPENSVWYTNVPIVDNRTDETRLETTPHLATQILGVNVDARYVVGTVMYDEPDIQDVDYQEAHTAIAGTERGKGISWGLFHDYEIYEFETPPDNKSQLAYGTLTYGFREAGDFFVFGSLGKESSYEDFTSASLEDTYWELGFRHVTGRRLIEAAFGDRSFGSTVSGRIRQEFNRGSLELVYREDPSVEEQLFEQRPTDAPSQPPPEVPPSIERPGVGDRFIYKLASATLIKELGRNRLEAMAFYDKRDQILERCEPAPECNATPPEDAVQDSETQVGFSLGLSRELGRRTTVGLEGELADREFRNGNEDRITALRLVANYDLGRKVGLEGYVARYRQSGSSVESDNYKEYQVGLSIGYDFL